MDTMEMRRNAIAELVNKHGTVSFAQIKEQFPQVSEMTLRTDLKALDAATYSPSRRLQKKQCSWFFRIP